MSTTGEVMAAAQHLVQAFGQHDTAARPIGTGTPGTPNFGCW
jgi:hypothetical protein